MALVAYSVACNNHIVISVAVQREEFCVSVEIDTISGTSLCVRRRRLLSPDAE